MTCSVRLQSESTFQFRKIQTWQSLQPLALFLVEIRDMRLPSFCRKFNFQQVLFEAFFDIINIFGSVEP